MTVKIKETGKIEQLGIYRDGINYVTDFIGNSGFRRVIDEDGNDVMDQADFDWWSDVIAEHQRIDDLLSEYLVYETFDLYREEMTQAVQGLYGSDLDVLGKEGVDSWFVERAREITGESIEIKVCDDGSFYFFVS